MCIANFRTNPITKSYELLSQVHQQLDKNNLLNKVVSKGGIPRSCQDVRLADPSFPSDVYWSDPDGQDVGDDHIQAKCKFKFILAFNRNLFCQLITGIIVIVIIYCYF